MPARKKDWKVGDEVNGFVVVSLERRDFSSGRTMTPSYTVHVRCPRCRRNVHRLPSNLRRSKSCGCARTARSHGVLRPSQPVPLTRYRRINAEFSRALLLDVGYAIEIATAASKLKSQQDAESPLC